MPLKNFTVSLAEAESAVVTAIAEADKRSASSVLRDLVREGLATKKQAASA